MADLDGIELIAFDMFGTLVKNDYGEWERTIVEIVERQELPVDGRELYAEWGKREVQFRKRRTNMADPDASPPFATYWQAWRDAYAETFDAMGLPGNAEEAADVSVEALSAREAFADAHAALNELSALRSLAVLSNADDRFLRGTIAHNGWSFPCVVSSEEARAYKPDPRVFAWFLQHVGLSAESVLYVGDSPYDDVHGAKLAGMRAVLVKRQQETPGRTPTPDGVTLLGPDYTVGSLSELPGLFA